MRIAVISDIHGNIEAFESVLQDIDSSDIDFIVNLGDSIGYGPNPNEVIKLLQKRDILNTLGNHEHAVLDENFRFFLKENARKSIEQTLRYLTPTSLSYLKKLLVNHHFKEAIFVHGCPPSSYEIYLNYLSLREIKNVFNSYRNQMAFVGHTHKLILISYNDATVQFNQLIDIPHKLECNWRYIVNVGSVGQPRDNDPRAGYIIWDSILNTVLAKRVPLNIEKTMRKIKGRGYQLSDAMRLTKGS